MRGEYTNAITSVALSMELPPRARRIPEAAEDEAPSPGTTSACAENTVRTIAQKSLIGNYLRVRGEYRAGYERT